MRIVFVQFTSSVVRNKNPNDQKEFLTSKHTLLWTRSFARKRSKWPKVDEI